MPGSYFTQGTFTFLQELADNNNRPWFEDNKRRYEELVRSPALAFIEDMAPALQLIAPRFQALAKKSGGSLMRVYRDTRFSKDKTPYKTNIGIQFRHEAGKDVHAPGYYLHVEPGAHFLGVGIWRPDATALGKIRERIHEQETKWLAARDHAEFRRRYTLAGETLVNPPRGYAKDHPLLEDLKRKDFIALCDLPESELLSPRLVANTVQRFEQATPFMQFLCAALEVGFD